MKKMKQRVIAILTLLVMVIGLIGMYEDVIEVKASQLWELEEEKETTYTVLLLDLGGYTLMNDFSGRYSYACQVEDMQQAAIKYIEEIKSSGIDVYVAVIAYTSDTEVISNFTNDYDNVINSIQEIKKYGGTSNINKALLEAENLFINSDVENVDKNILNFTKGLNCGGMYDYTGKYSSSVRSWYKERGYYDIKYIESYANCTYTTFERLKDNYNIYTVLFLQKYNENIKGLIDFSRKFGEDIQNAGYIEVEDVDDLIFDFGCWDAPVIPVTFMFASTYAHKDVEAVCYYSDSYFENDSTDYNEHLATMSLCLELSTWSSEKDYTIWTDSEQAAFPKFMNAQGLLGQLGFKEFKVNEAWSDKPTADSIGAVVANKTLPDGSTLVALAIRGGGYEQEWASNFTLGYEGDHKGFAEASDNVIDFLYRYLNESCITGDVKLWIVGYSRGGAVANLVAAELSYPINNFAGYSWNRENVYAYTFEAPQGAMESINKRKYDNIHNTINVNDLVPNVAPSSWDFVRYGTDIYLPNSVNVGDAYAEAYTEAIDKMEKYLSQFKKDSEEKSFVLEEKVSVAGIEIDMSTMLFWGVPSISIKPRIVSRYVALKDMVDCLADDIIGSRENYYYHYQTLIRKIISMKYNENIFDDEGVKAEFVLILKKKLTYKRILKILSPLITKNLINGVEAEEQVVDNIKQLIQEALDESGSGYAIIALTEIDDILSEFLYNLLMVLWDGIRTDDYEKINNVLAVISMGFEGTLFQPHYPEFTLAWMMYKDSYYGENDKIKVGRSYRVIHINCPVDVNVYSEDSGKLVASIIDDVPQDVENSYIVSYVNSDGEKIVILPADTNYSVNIEATGNGKFNYTIDEYSYAAQGNTRTLNYYDIVIEEGDILKARVPKMCDEELYGENLTGSTTVYSLFTSDNVEITPNNEVFGETALVEYEVKVTLGNEYGYVLGGGDYSVGSFALVEAYPYVGGEFIGWYYGEELVSTDKRYRFAVKENVELVARFLEVEMYSLNFKANEGGTIANIPLTVPAGVSVQLEAEAIEGYEFDYWSTNGNGMFDDVTSPSTMYTMTEENTTIEAHWKKQEVFDEEIEPEGTVKEPMNKDVVDIKTGDNINIWLLTLIPAVVGIIAFSKKILLDR